MSVVRFFYILCQLVLLIGESSGVLSDMLKIKMKIYRGKEKSYGSTRKKTFQTIILETVGDFVRESEFSRGGRNFGSKRSLQSTTPG